MKDSIEKAVRDLGVIRIENMIGTEIPTNIIGLYPKDYDTVAGHFSCSEENPAYQRNGGNHYARKK